MKIINRFHRNQSSSNKLANRNCFQNMDMQGSFAPINIRHTTFPDKNLSIFDRFRQSPEKKIVSILCLDRVVQSKSHLCNREATVWSSRSCFLQLVRNAKISSRSEPRCFELGMSTGETFLFPGSTNTTSLFLMKEIDPHSFGTALHALSL